MKIVKVKIFLDDNVPEYMDGIIKCGRIISYDEGNNELDHQKLINLHNIIL